MLRIPNPNNILAFVTVAREGSVSRAADSLNLTQPAISYQIKKLAEETGLTLFTRTPTGVQLTSDGKAILEQAERVLDAMQDFRRSATGRLDQISGKLRLGTIVDPEFIRLGRLLALLRRDDPGIETHLMHGVSGHILAWLKRDQIDAGFYLNAPGDPPETSEGDLFHSVKLADFNYRVIAPAAWGARIETLGWRELAALPWIGTPEQSVHHRLLARIFDQHDCTPNVVALVDQEASMLEMVRSGIGLSLCRDSIALHQKQTFGLGVSPTVSVPACLSFTCLTRNKDRPVVAEAFRLLEEAW